MIATTADGHGGEFGASLRNKLWAHPDWWVRLISGLAWVCVIKHGIDHWGHEHHQPMTFVTEWWLWTVMVAAMMLPLVLSMVRTVAFRSLATRRHRATSMFLAGYLIPWSVLGVVVSALRQTTWMHASSMTALMFGLAAVWGLTPAQSVAMMACHRTVPLSPAGAQADRDCLRFGAWNGAACVGSCWALMVACTASGHSLVAMVVGALLAAIERFSFRPPRNLVAAATFLLALGYGVAAAMS